MLILVSGGSASGKSEFAESLVLQSGCDRRYYLATMIPYDEECRRRISRHRKMRAAKGFETIEVPVRLRGISFPSALKEGAARCWSACRTWPRTKFFPPTGRCGMASRWFRKFWKESTGCRPCANR